VPDGTRLANLLRICSQEGSCMTRIIRKAVVVVLILVGAGIAAAATSPVIMGPSVGISSPISPLTTTGGVTTTTVGDTTTVIGTSNPVTTGGATTPTTPTTTTPGTTAPVSIEQVVTVTRTVEAGTPVNAFVVPAANRLVVTDVVITNPTTTPACGASVAGSRAVVTTVAAPPSGTTSTPTTTTGATAPGATTTGVATRTTTGAVTTSAAADLASTGVLCIPAQTSLTLALTTGLEFAGGQSVLLGNQASPGGTTASGPLFYHLRGFLISGV